VNRKLAILSVALLPADWVIWLILAPLLPYWLRRYQLWSIPVLVALNLVLAIKGLRASRRNRDRVGVGLSIAGIMLVVLAVVGIVALIGWAVLSFLFHPPRM